MSKQPIPMVQNGFLYHANAAAAPIAVGSAAWFDALSQLRSFAFESGAGHTFTARCEQRRKRDYWYAFRRRDGKVRKVYLGRAKKLTLDFLDEKALELSGAKVAPSSPPISTLGTNHIVLSTKLRIPAIPHNMIYRPRLTNQVQLPLSEYASRAYTRRSRPLLTLIVAPPGYGKSTLLSEWASQHPTARVSWLSLERDDNDLYQFWQYVVAALQNASPELGQAATALLQDFQPPTIQLILTTLLNEIQSYPHQLALVLDDYHLIQQEAIHESLIFFLNHCPARLHLIITSRTPLPLPLSRLRTCCHLTELDRDDLRFTHDEGVRFLREDTRLSLDAETIDHLADRTDGWAAGMNLMVLALRKSKKPAAMMAVIDGQHSYLTEYFFENVWQEQPEDVQQFLLYTSVLDNLSPPLCTAVTQLPNVGAILSYLRRINLFLIALDEKQGWYRYHHLFSSALRRLLKQTQLEIIPELHSRAAQWYLAQDNTIDALRHLIEAEAFRQTAAVLECAALPLLQQGKVTRLIAWLESLPEDVLHQYPLLMSTYGRALMLTGEMGALEAWLKRMEATELPHDNVQAEVAQIRAVFDGVELEGVPSKGHWWESLDLFTLSVNLWGQNRLQQAYRAAERATITGRAVGHDSIVLLAGSNLAFLPIVQGRLREGLRLARQELRLAQLDEQAMVQGVVQPNPAVAPLLMAIAYVFYERNQLEQSLTYYRRAIHLRTQFGRVDYLMAGHLLMARLLGTLGQAEEAHQMIARGVQMAREADMAFWPLPDAEAYQAWMWLHYGDLSLAVDWMKRAGLRPDDEAIEQRRIHYSVYAEILLTLGQYEEARETISRLIAVSPQGTRTEQLANLWLLQALALYKLGEEDDAMDVLSQACDSMAPEGYIRPFLDRQKEVKPLLTKLMQKQGTASSVTTYAQMLLSLMKSKAGVRSAIHLAPREAEVLGLVKLGVTNRRIAEELIISPNTVKTHLRHVYRKLEVNSRTQAVIKAQEMGLL